MVEYVSNLIQFRLVYYGTRSNKKKYIGVAFIFQIGEKQTHVFVLETLHFTGSATRRYAAIDPP